MILIRVAAAGLLSAMACNVAFAETAVDIIDRMPCASLNSDEFARIFHPKSGQIPDRDNPNYETHLGVMYFDWDNRSVAALRQRVKACGADDEVGSLTTQLQIVFENRLDRIQSERAAFERTRSYADVLNGEIDQVTKAGPLKLSDETDEIRRRVAGSDVSSSDRRMILERLDEVEAEIAEARQIAKEDADVERRVAREEAEVRRLQAEAERQERETVQRQSSVKEADARAKERAAKHDERLTAEDERAQRLKAAIQAREEAEKRVRVAGSQNERLQHSEAEASGREQALADEEEAAKRKGDTLERELAASPACRKAAKMYGEMKDIEKEVAMTVVQVNAGMAAEACNGIKRIYLRAEEFRSTMADCNPVEAYGPNQFVVAIRDMAAEQRCRL